MSEPGSSRDLLAAFARLGTATVYEALGSGDLDPAISALWPEAKLCGPAFTVHCPAGDNLMAHYAVAKARPGDVLAISTGGESDRAWWGSIMSRAAQQRGLGGLVIDGRVRDSAEIEERGFPVFCRGRAIRGTSKVGVGKVDVSIMLGNRAIAPGDILVGDRDGVVVVPRARAGIVLEAAVAREAKEDRILRDIESGALTVDLLELRDALERARLL